MFGQTQYTITITANGYCRDYKSKSYTRLANFRKEVKRILTEYPFIEFVGILTTNHYYCGTDRINYREYEIIFSD